MAKPGSPGFRGMGFLWQGATTILFVVNLIRPWPAADPALAYLGPGTDIVLALAGSSGESGRTRIVLPVPLQSLDADEVIEHRAQLRVVTHPRGLPLFGLRCLTGILMSLAYGRSRVASM